MDLVQELVKGFGINGVGNVSQYALAQFSLDTTAGTVSMGLINGNQVGNPGTVSLSGTIQGSNGDTGTWSVNLTPGSTYTDFNGTSITPESTGNVSLAGLNLQQGVTYNLNT